MKPPDNCPVCGSPRNPLIVRLALCGTWQCGSSGKAPWNKEDIDRSVHCVLATIAPQVKEWKQKWNVLWQDYQTRQNAAKDAAKTP